MSDRGSCWSVTINNPSATDEECIALARQKGWKVEGQLETGSEGTPHYQLLVRTPQVRFSAVKKQFPRAHIELARNPQALSAYVHKEATRTGELATGSDKYPSQEKVWSWYAAFYLETFGMPYSQATLPTEEQLLECFDQMVARKIEEGFYLELIGVNPQVRSAIKRYGVAIVSREVRRQTDKTDASESSEPDQNILLPESINGNEG